MQRPVVGLALGSGATRGYAHIGVLKVLKREDIPIDIVTGSSMGAVIGALYASGIEVEEIENLASEVQRRHWIDFALPTEGLIAGKKLENMLLTLTKNKDFSQLTIPLGVMATNLTEKKSVLISQGNVARAVRTSISIPGIFTPIVDSGQVLVDGGALVRLPGKEAKTLGAEFVIGVELGCGSNSSKTGIYDVLMQTYDVMGEQLQNLKGYGCDVLITPELSGIGAMTFTHSKDIIAAGEAATRKVLPKILQGLKKRS